MAEEKTNYEKFYELLVRLDERILVIQESLVTVKAEQKEATTKLEKFISSNQDHNLHLVQEIKDDLDDFKKEAEKEYVKKELFAPIQKIVYGVAGLILSAVFTAILALILKQ